MGQHTVPAQYLRNFEDPGRTEFIWLHDKRGGQSPRQVAIEKVLQQRQFYPDDMERHLAKAVELPANQVIDKLLATRTINQAERLSLAIYVGSMLRRVPFHREWAKGLIPTVLAQILASTRQQIQAIADESQMDPELIARRFREVDQFEERCSRETPPEVTEKIHDPIPSDIITTVLDAMTWRILISAGPQYFITTDNPAFFFRGEGYGLGNPLSELSFPLSTTHALHGSFQTTRGNLIYVPVCQRTVREINRRLVSQADRIALYHKPAPWLFPLLAKQNLYLSRIQW
jgi:Protein of unknown function (DUF4238)